MTTATALASRTMPARRLGRSAALWLQAAIVLAFFAASTAPSPLYAVWREAWGFSALVLTVVFASYAFALLAALLVLGKLSDHRGRRVVMLGGIVLEFVSVLAFWQADSVGWLIAARALQGVATGIATSVTHMRTKRRLNSVSRHQRNAPKSPMRIDVVAVCASVTAASSQRSL